MTQTTNPRPSFRYAAVLAVAAALICAIGALAAVALTVQLARHTAPAAPAAPAQLHRIDAIPAAQAQQEAPSGLGTDYGIVMLALGEGADYTPEQVAEVLASADRVCEGRTAGVPDEIMAQTVARQEGLDQARAQQFVALVGATRCAG